MASALTCVLDPNDPRHKTVTLREFAERALHITGFGRIYEELDLGCDDRFPEKLPLRPSRRDPNRIKRLRKDLERLQAMIPAEACRQARAAYRDAMSYYRKQVAYKKAVQKSKARMRKLVDAWKEPDTHTEFKGLMLRQIEECGGKYTPEKPKKQTEVEWLADEIRMTKRAIKFEEEAIKDHEGFQNNDQIFLDALRASLPEGK